ncbi:hypothetical protein [Micromonospora sp. NPDC047740]|uniref:hypothetical protein n=1 Tax=Micromonospora sp. NPDC047740 TaxID=3364254 RepID=UPI0037136343
MTVGRTLRDLDALMAAASEVVVRERFGGVLAATSDPAALAQLRFALRVGSVLDGFCMCLGEYAVDFLDDTGQLVAAVSYHHAVTLRWDGFTGDGELVDGTALLYWLAGRGCQSPLDRFRAQNSELVAAEARSRRAEDSWRAAAPLPSSVVDALVETSRSGSHTSDDQVGSLCEQLQAAYPEALERTLVLLAWRGAGTGRISGYPSYEEVPDQMLARLPLATIAQALSSPTAADGHFVGALSHLTSWHSRKRRRRELDQLPPEIRARLLAVGLESHDAAIRDRAQRKLGQTNSK